MTHVCFTRPFFIMPTASKLHQLSWPSGPWKSLWSSEKNIHKTQLFSVFNATWNMKYIQISWESRFVLTFIFHFSEVPSGTSQLIPPVTNMDQSDPWLRPFRSWLPLKRCSAMCLLKGISSLICARVLIGVSPTYRTPTTTGVSPRNTVRYVDLLGFVPEHYTSIVK